MSSSRGPIARRLAQVTIVAAFAAAIAATPATADTVGPINFETYSLGTIWGQQGWTGDACGFPYDIEVADNSAFPAAPASFGTKSYRISNAVTSGCFEDSFSTPVANEAGEATAANGGFSGGVRQPDFITQFTFASATGGYQPGLAVQVSPDRGDGARMSYVRMRHIDGHLNLTFIDAQGTDGTPPPCFQCANFVQSDLGNYDPGKPHTVRIESHYANGNGNDRVRVFVDGSRKHVGTSWEDYYELDTESSPFPPRVSRTVDSLLIRGTGGDTPSTDGKGFLIDGLSVASGHAATTLEADPVVLEAPPLELPVLVGLRAHLRAQGGPLAGRSVTFSVKGNRLCTGKTNQFGVANCAKLLSAGQLAALLAFGYDARFAGDLNHFAASDNAGLIELG